MKNLNIREMRSRLRDPDRLLAKEGELVVTGALALIEQLREVPLRTLDAMHLPWREAHGYGPSPPRTRSWPMPRKHPASKPIRFSSRPSR